MSLTTLAVYAERFGNRIQRILGGIILHLNNVEIPAEVKIGKNVQFIHNSYGTVLHPSTEIEDDVQIYQNVTCGRGDCWVKTGSKFKKIIIKKGACICPGAKIICSKGVLVVGENTVIGANAVLTSSTGNNEIWAGVPAKFVRNRDE